MGFIRGTLLVFVSILALVILILWNVSLTFSYSLEYKNVKSEFKNALLNVSELSGKNSNYFNNLKGYALTYCFTSKETNVSRLSNDTNFRGLIGSNFTIPCEIIRGGEESVLNFSSEKILFNVYYKNYTCGFFECFENDGLPLFLVSKKTHDYFSDQSSLLLILIIVSAILIFILTEEKANAFLLIGVFLTISSLPLIFLSKFLSSFLEELSSLTSIFFSEAGTVFLFMLLSGIAFIIGGIILKILLRFSTKKKFSLNEVKQIVKDEVSKFKKNNIRIASKNSSKKK